jgi:hypothetical protein
MLDSRISTPILITSRHAFSRRPRIKKNLSKFSEKTNV